MIVVNTVFNLLIMNKVIVMFKEGFQELRNTILYNSFLEDLADYKLYNEFHSTQKFLPELFQE